MLTTGALQVQDVFRIGRATEQLVHGEAEAGHPEFVSDLCLWSMNERTCSRPFCEYRDSNRNARIAHIIHALKTLTNADYKNITRLAKDVAKIVTEFEAKGVRISQRRR